VSNYGAVLQAFALKEAVKDFGDVKIIDFDNKHVSKSLKHIRFGTSLHSILGMGKDLCRLLPRIKVIKKFNSFLTDNMELTPFESKSLESFDVLISGSDQIWNPRCISPSLKFLSEYFLDFGNESQRKISYASSCGSYEFSSKELLVLKEYLEKYQYLGVRELKTSVMLTDLLDTEVQHVVDPTLLLTKEDWLIKLGDNNFRKEEYILVYVIKKTELLKNTIKYIKSALDLKVILVEQGLYFDNIIDEHIRDAGPEDFISLINNAKYIITDSFHGTTFSVIFNKPFVSVSPGANVNRISSLLEKIGLKDRIIHNSNNINELILDCDFKLANKALNEERIKSKNYLTKALTF
jgi:hypothetical protein